MTEPCERRADQSLLDWVRDVDPEVAEAVRDVDRTLIEACLRLSPLERLRWCTRNARGLGRFRVAP
ncbi:MAG: hypothetical protein AB7S26_42825 [Sandaracinaceae bacterium]